MQKNKLQTILFISLPFILSIGAHFLYSFIPFPLLAIYFPIKESVFEHIKLTFTPIILTYLFSFLKSKNKIPIKKYLSSLIISIVSSLIIMLATYYICFSVFKKDIVIVSILCLALALIIGQSLGIYIYKKNISWSIEISIYILITMTFTLLLLTINPPDLDFFIDKSKQSTYY